MGLQVQLLRSLFEQALGEEGTKHVDINTIDGFQVGAMGRAELRVCFYCIKSAEQQQPGLQIRFGVF
jgi:hypothetical protein